jgi:hypothetical protein
MDSTAVVIMLLGLPRATARYQLTALGGAAPNLHVAEEISENRFKIAGGEERMEIDLIVVRLNYRRRSRGVRPGVGRAAR